MAVLRRQAQHTNVGKNPPQPNALSLNTRKAIIVEIKTPTVIPMDKSQYLEFLVILNLIREIICAIIAIAQMPPNIYIMPITIL